MTDEQETSPEETPAENEAGDPPCLADYYFPLRPHVRQAIQGKIDQLMGGSSAFQLTIRTTDGKRHGPAGYLRTEDDLLFVEDCEAGAKPYHLAWSDIAGVRVEELP